MSQFLLLLLFGFACTQRVYVNVSEKARLEIALRPSSSANYFDVPYSCPDETDFVECDSMGHITFANFAYSELDVRGLLVMPIACSLISSVRFLLLKQTGRAHTDGLTRLNNTPIATEFLRNVSIDASLIGELRCGAASGALFDVCLVFVSTDVLSLDSMLFAPPLRVLTIKSSLFLGLIPRNVFDLDVFELNVSNFRRDSLTVLGTPPRIPRVCKLPKVKCFFAVLFCFVCLFLLVCFVCFTNKNYCRTSSIALFRVGLQLAVLRLAIVAPSRQARCRRHSARRR